MLCSNQDLSSFHTLSYLHSAPLSGLTGVGSGVLKTQKEIVMAHCVVGDQYYGLDGQLTEIKRQLRQPVGYPYDPEQLRIALQAIIEGRFQTTGGVTSWPIWKTIILGRNTSPSAYREALKANGYRIDGHADQILNKVKVSKTGVQIDLVVKTAAELGFKNDDRRDAIYARAIELGLELCPAEVGPALRLQYPYQPNGGWFLIAMRPVSLSGGDPWVFAIIHDGDGRWLGSRCDDPGGFWRADGHWVFAAPRK